MRRFRRTSPVVPACEYCEELDRYNLDPAREIDCVFWHYEKKAYCRAVPRMRVRCRKNNNSL